jgi:uncharacterized protein (DUF2126 family)
MIIFFHRYTVLEFLNHHDYAPRGEWIINKWQTQRGAITAAHVEGDSVLGYVVLRPGIIYSHPFSVALPLTHICMCIVSW